MMRILLWQQARFPRQSSVVKRGTPGSTCRSLQERGLEQRVPTEAGRWWGSPSHWAETSQRRPPADSAAGPDSGTVSSSENMGVWFLGPPPG